MPNYGVGDTVVCVDAIGALGSVLGTGLKAGKNYKVLGIGRAQCCGQLQVDVGLPPSIARSTKCMCGAIITPATNYRYAWRFIKLDGLKVEETAEAERVTRSCQ